MMELFHLINGVSFGISFVLDEVGCSMLVLFSGSTPSLDHSFDVISSGISLDHTLAISFWYVLLVEPSSCNLHEGTLVFLIQGGGGVILCREKSLL